MGPFREGEAPAEPKPVRNTRLGGSLALPVLQKKPPREATGHTTAQDRYCLGLLPFGPDPVHSRPLHRARPLLAARKLVMSGGMFYKE